MPLSEKQKISQALYREKHREYLRDLNRKNYYKDLEKSRNRAKEFSRKNKEKIVVYRKGYMKTPNGRLTSIKGSAKTRGIEYNLTKDAAIKLLTSECTYCGLHNSQIGIDRLDSDLGYTNENCVSSCTICNYMKRIMTYNDFINQCTLIARKHNVF